MVVSILSHEQVQGIESRLAVLGFHAQRFTPDSIRELSHDSSKLIYLVPFSAMDAPDWPQLRVRLAQANRYYIVVGKALGSAQIMNAARDGAYDVILVEDDDERWRNAVCKVADSQTLWLQLYGGKPLGSQDGMIGASPAMKSLRQAIERLGPTSASVLILGESGVGKERVASGLHKASGRGSFVAVNCAAIPKELMEAELFGAEKGAYTGASKTRAGLVEEAAGGTLFLDEIGELDFRLQPKLLRFLETHLVRRVGGSSESRVEVRVLSATNSNLETEVSEGKFRADLYYRLSEVTLRVPPLRSRLEDVPLFSLAFLQSSSERFGKHFEMVEPELVKKFQDYDWPGNVRELKNTIDRMVILYDGPVLRTAWWNPPRKTPSATGPESSVPQSRSGMGRQEGDPIPARMGSHRRQKFESARKLLEESGNDLTWVAAQLGIHPTTLYRWRKTNKI